jgi:hypothetical protein
MKDRSKGRDGKKQRKKKEKTKIGPDVKIQSGNPGLGV